MGLLTLNELTSWNGLGDGEPPTVFQRPGARPPALTVRGGYARQAGQARGYVSPAARRQQPVTLAPSYRRPASRPSPRVSAALARLEIDRQRRITASALRRASRPSPRRRRSAAPKPPVPGIVWFPDPERDYRSRYRRDRARRIRSIGWTTPVSQLPTDLTSARGESWGDWGRRESAALRRGFSVMFGTTPKNPFTPSARFRRSVETRRKDNVRDSLIKMNSTDAEFRAYQQLPGEIRQAVFETVASPNVVRAVGQGQGRNQIMLRELFR